jgi:hypothetical protein
MIIQNDILGTLRTLIFNTRAYSKKEEVVNISDDTQKNVNREDFMNPVPGVPGNEPVIKPEVFPVPAECWKCANRYQCKDCEHGLKEPMTVAPELGYRPFYFGCKRAAESLEAPGAAAAQNNQFRS